MGGREGGGGRRKKVSKIWKEEKDRGGGRKERGGGRKSPGSLYTTHAVVEDAGHTIIIHSENSVGKIPHVMCAVVKSMPCNPHRPSPHTRTGVNY